MKHEPEDENVERINPAAFGRLCVETVSIRLKELVPPSSRLRAAVC